MTEKRKPRSKAQETQAQETQAQETQAQEPQAGGKTARYRVAASVPRRYRAGLGPFGPAPVEVDLTEDQLAAIEADPYLTATAVDG